MLLLKSLFCLKGHDNGRRFLVISSVAYLLLLLLLPILAQANILLTLLLLTVSPILLLSAMRRIHDAHFATPFAAIPVIIFWLNLFGLTYLEHGSKWVLLVLAMISSLGFAALNNIRIRKNANYHFGYNGPLNLDAEPSPISPLARVEPTIEGQPLSENTPQETLESELKFERSHITEKELTTKEPLSHSRGNSDWLSMINQFIANNLRLSYGTAGLLLLVILTTLIVPLFGSEPVVDKKASTEAIDEIKQRLNKIEMPDQFWVMLDQYDAITIAWEGDLKQDEELGQNGLYWSAATIEGDKDCASLDFTLGEKLRSLKVTVKNGGDYYADFSPLDTQVIVQSIANKDRFKLCGYEFSLNGTRSLLRKNDQYRRYFTR